MLLHFAILACRGVHYHLSQKNNCPRSHRFRDRELGAVWLSESLRLGDFTDLDIGDAVDYKPQNLIVSRGRALPFF